MVFGVALIGRSMPEERCYTLPNGVKAAWYTATNPHRCYMCTGIIPAGQYCRRTQWGYTWPGKWASYRHACQECGQVDDVERAMMGPGSDPVDDHMNQEELGDGTF